MVPVADFVDFLPLYQETTATVRARLDTDANAGLVEDDARYTDVREGSMYQAITEPLALEFARLWDALGTEVPAAAFVAYAWGDYLDAHALIYGLERKAGTLASGTVLFTGTENQVVASGIGVGTKQTDADVAPPSFVTTESGTVSATVAVPTGLGATPSGSGGTLAAGTYNYVVTATNAYGETTPCAEVPAITSGTTSKVTLDWNDMTGATGYRVYRRTSGTTDLLVAVSVSGYIDTGAVAPDATKHPPGANTTGGKLRVAIDATDIGTAYNVSAGAIAEILTPAPGVASVTNESQTLGGTEPESDEDLRTRLMALFIGGGAGNEADYQRWALGRDSVGRVFVKGLWQGAGTVQVVIMDANGDPVAPAVVTDVQDYLDPTPGLGHGRAPVGAIVTVQTPSVVSIAIVATLVLRTGYTLDGSGGTIAVRETTLDALGDYLDALPVGEDVVYDHVRAQFFVVPGVYAVTSLTIQGGTSDVAITSDPPQVASLGTTSFTA